jgi:predicted Zn finger-like uncharacterized protein
MSDTAECPQCGRQLHVPDSVLGRSVKCPACGMTFTAGESAVRHVPEAPIPFRDPLSPPRQDDRDRDDDTPYRRRIRRDFMPHRGGVVLTFGILSLVCGCLSIIFGPTAWVMGNNDLHEIRAGRMDPQGEGLTQAGRICGMVGTGLALLSFCWIGVAVLAETAGP